MAASVVTLLRSATQTAARLSMILGGINPIFAQLGGGAKEFVKTLSTGIQQAQKYFGQIKQFYNETIRLVQELQSGTRNSAITIASNVDLLVATGDRVTDSAQKIALLMPELKKIQESLITRAPQIIGVTADELLQTFNQVSIQFGQLTGQIKGLEKFGLTTELQAAEELTIRLSSAMKTVGLRQRDIAQEVRAILTGTIDRNARLARQLDISSAQIKAEKAKGTLAAFILEKTEASVAANALFNDSIGNTLSVLESFQKQFSRSIGEGAFEGFKEGLLTLRKTLEANQDKILEWGKEIGAVIGPAFKNMMTAVSGVIEAIIASKDQIQPIIKFLIEIFFETGEVIAGTVSGTIMVLNGLGKAIGFLVDMFDLGFQTIYGVLEGGAQLLEDVSNKIADFFGLDQIEKGSSILAKSFDIIGDKIRIANGYKLNNATKEITGFQETISDTGWVKKTAGAFVTLFRQIPILGDSVRKSNQDLNKRFIQTADNTGRMAQTATKSFDEIREAAENAAEGSEEKAGLVERYIGSKKNIDSLVEESMEALEELDAQMKGGFAEFDKDAFAAQLKVYNDIFDMRMSQALTEAELLEDFDKQKIAKLEAWKIERASLATALEKAALNAKDPIQQQRVRQLRQKIADGDEEILAIQQEISAEFDKQKDILTTTAKDIERFGASSEAAASQVEDIFEGWERGTRKSLEVVKEMPKEFKAIELAIKNGGFAQEELNDLYDIAVSEITKIKDVDQREKVVKAVIKVEKELNKLHKEETKAYETNLKLLETQGIISAEQLDTANKRLEVTKEIEASMMLIEEFTLSQKLNAEDNTKIEQLRGRASQLEVQRAEAKVQLAKAQTQQEVRIAEAKLERIKINEVKIIKETIAELEKMEGHDARILVAKLRQKEAAIEIKDIEADRTEAVEKTLEAQRELTKLLQEQQADLEYLNQLYTLAGNSVDIVSQKQKEIALATKESQQAQEAYNAARKAEQEAELAFLEEANAKEVNKNALEEASTRLTTAKTESLKQANRQYNSQLTALRAMQAIDAERLKRANNIKQVLAKTKIAKIDFKLGNLGKFQQLVKTLESAPKGFSSELKSMLSKTINKLKPVFKDINQEGVKGVKAQIKLLEERAKAEQEMADDAHKAQQLESDQRIAQIRLEQQKQKVVRDTGIISIDALNAQAQLLVGIIDALAAAGTIPESAAAGIKQQIQEASQAAEEVKDNMAETAGNTEDAVDDVIEYEKRLQEANDAAKENADTNRKNALELEKGALFAGAMADELERAGDAPPPKTPKSPGEPGEPGEPGKKGKKFITRRRKKGKVIDIPDMTLKKGRSGGSIVLKLENLLGADRFDEWARAKQELDTKSLRALEEFKEMLKKEHARNVKLGKFSAGSRGLNLSKIIENQKAQMVREAGHVIALWKAQKRREEEALRKQEEQIRKQEEQLRKAEERKIRIEQLKEEAKKRRMEARQQAADALSASWEQTRAFIDELRVGTDSPQDILTILSNPEFQKMFGFGEDTEENIDESQNDVLVEKFGQNFADKLRGIVDIDEKLIDQLNKGTAKQSDLIDTNKIFLDPETGQIIVTGKDPDFDKLRQLIELQTISSINEKQVDALGRIEGLTEDQNNMLFEVFEALNGQGGVNILDTGQVTAFGVKQSDPIDFAEEGIDGILDASKRGTELTQGIFTKIKKGFASGKTLEEIFATISPLGIDESSIRAIGHGVGEIVASNTGEAIDIARGIADGSFLAENAVAIEAAGVNIEASTIEGLEEMFGKIEGLIDDMPTSQEAITVLSRLPDVGGTGTKKNKKHNIAVQPKTVGEALVNLNTQLGDLQTTLNNQKYQGTYVDFDIEYTKDKFNRITGTKVTGADIRDSGTGKLVETINFNNNNYTSIDQAQKNSSLSYWFG